MFKSQLLRQTARAFTYTRPQVTRVARPQLAAHARLISSTPRRFDDAKDPEDEDRYRSSSTAAEPNETAVHEGQFARTDESITVEYPEETDLPRSQIIQGRGGFHLKRTLDTFSLEGRVAVVTGGARGLGLVMGQSLVQSGADLAIVDLNRKHCIFSSSSQPRSSSRALTDPIGHDRFHLPYHIT